MTRAFAAGALLVALLLAGCSGTAAPPLPSDGSTADARTPDPDPVDLSIRTHEPGPALTADAARGDLSMPWKLVSINAQSIDIIAAIGNGGCIQPAGYRVEESTSYVELWVYSRRVPTKRCVTLVEVWHTTVPLTTPLGSRALLHPPTDPAWQASYVFNGAAG